MKITVNVILFISYILFMHIVYRRVAVNIILEVKLQTVEQRRSEFSRESPSIRQSKDTELS